MPLFPGTPLKGLEEVFKGERHELVRVYLIVDKLLNFVCRQRAGTAAVATGSRAD
jgi:hypothetical protein